MSTPAQLVRLIYVSRRPRQTNDEIVIDGIILPALRKNRARDITGCLWFNRDHFFQVLEGETGAVTAMYETIERDPRHSDARLVDMAVITSRTFERFAMKLVGGESNDEIEGLVRQFGSRPEAIVAATSEGAGAGTPPGAHPGVRMRRGARIPWLERVVNLLVNRTERAGTPPST
ncbi:hypothetical protein BH11PLA1_BH11PLA1_14240 [soil metagenome]